MQDILQREMQNTCTLVSIQGAVPWVGADSGRIFVNTNTLSSTRLFHSASNDGTRRVHGSPRDPNSSPQIYCTIKNLMACEAR